MIFLFSRIILFVARVWILEIVHFDLEIRKGIFGEMLRVFDNWMKILCRVQHHGLSRRMNEA